MESEKHGIFSTYELSNEEKDLFIEYLQHSINNPVMEFVHYLLGDDYLQFVDILAGSTIRIPPIKTLEKDLISVKMYIYVKDRDFTEDAVRVVSKLYNKNYNLVKRCIYRVAKSIGVEDTLEGDVLNNYILNIKSIDDYNKKCSDEEKDEEDE